MGHYRDKGRRSAPEAPVQDLIATTKSDGLDELSSLVDELSKASPCQKTVKFYMERFELPYSEDSVESLKTVLQAMYQEMIYENPR